MQKSAKSSAAGKAKKPYSTPKLTTHGDVRKLTQGHGHGKGAASSGGSNMFDLPGGGKGHGNGRDD